MKRKLSTLVIILLITVGCATSYQDVEDIVNDTNHAPDSAIAEYLSTYSYVEPQDWDGTIVTWAVSESRQTRPMLVRQINSYLASVDASYRIGLLSIKPSVDEWQYGNSGRYYEEMIEELADEFAIDIVHRGYNSFQDPYYITSGLIQEDQIQPIDSEDMEVMWSELVTNDGQILGIGSPISIVTGLFIPETMADDLIDDLEAYSPEEIMNYLQEIYQAESSPELYLMSRGPELLGELIAVEDWLILDQGGFKPWWHHPMYDQWQEWLAGYEITRGHPAYDVDNVPIIADSRVFQIDGKKANRLDTNEAGYFVPLVLNSLHRTLGDNLENMMLATSENQDEAIDFLYRLNQNVDLITLLSEDSSHVNRKEIPWYKGDFIVYINEWILSDQDQWLIDYQRTIRSLTEDFWNNLESRSIDLSEEDPRWDTWQALLRMEEVDSTALLELESLLEQPLQELEQYWIEGD